MKVLFILLPIVFISGSFAGKKWDNINKLLTGWKNRPELRLWPGFDTGTPVKVRLGLYIYSFHGTPVDKGTISFEGYLQMSWNDPRLKFDKTLGKIIPDINYITKYMWIPQIRFPSVTNVEFSSMGSETGMHIRSNGRVSMVRRFVAELDCYMKFNKFPYDNQTCTMYIYYLGYGFNQVQLSWRGLYVRKSEHGMFRLTNYTKYNVIRNYTSFSWQYMGAKFQITRNHGHYVSSWYVPTIFIIGLVYIAFWMPETYLLAKTLLTTALYLSYVWLMVSSVNDGPKVPYMTEFDKWFLVNLLFMSFAILEVLVFHLVHAYVRGDVKVEDFQNKGEGQDDAAGATSNALLFALDFKLRVMRGVTWGLRIAFPVAYFLFLIIYFAMNKT